MATETLAVALPDLTQAEIEAFSARLAQQEQEESQVEAEWVEIEGKRVVWAPQEGSQTEFLSCPMPELLYHGTRGPGKTDALLMDFAQHVGKGFGRAWRGIIFRQTYPELADVVAKSEKWFYHIFPGAKFNRGKMYWEWPTGEVLFFRHMAKIDDYKHYHGHEYPWIAFEELTNWPTDECYRVMFSCCRSTRAGMPRKVRATTNPYGVGHNWVKQRFNLHGRYWETQIVSGEDGIRVAIHGHIDENKRLLSADPGYKKRILAAATNPAQAEAWLNGAWDIVAGGMFDDVWKPSINIVRPFVVPDVWRVYRSFDWGSSRPFSVGWWAVSDGTTYTDSEDQERHTVRGDLFRINEWYGWNGQPNQGLKMLAVDVAKGIVERELAMFGATRKVLPGAADAAIYVVENGNSIAVDMAKPVKIAGKVYPGVRWVPSDKSPGSRKMGWEMLRKVIKQAHPGENGEPRENAGLFVTTECEQFIRTVPTSPRDKKKLDDVDTDAEDHIADEARYFVRSQSRTKRTTGGVGVGGVGPRLVEG